MPIIKFLLSIVQEMAVFHLTHGQEPRIKLPYIVFSQAIAFSGVEAYVKCCFSIHHHV